MGASVNHSAHAISRHLKVLLPSSNQKLRISGELARRLDGDDGSGGMAMLVSPLGSKVWPVEVGQEDDGDGVILGRGWPEFVAAHGIGALWFLVLRHEGRGVLTVKAFDTSFCLHEFSRPLNAAAVNRSDTAGSSRRPQFIKVLLGGFTEKMVIPPEFVRNHITKVGTNSPLAVLLNLCGKYWCVEAKKDRSGNVFFSGGWSRFLESNGITEGDALVLRYEGNLLFTVKAFGVDGCQKSFNSTKIGLPHIEETDQMKMKEETDAPSSSTGKRKSRNEVPSIAKPNRPASSSVRSKKRTAAATSTSVSTYHIEPPSWIRKRINASALKNHLALAYTFCKAIGFSKHCEIMLRTSTGNGATRSWKVRGQAYSLSHHYQFGKGWTSFCRDNKLNEGDVCTFNVIETTLWDVDISRCS